MNDATLAVCPVCPRHCRLAEGQTGFCRARRADGGVVVPTNYGCITSLALDPIEKKPFALFRPETNILSVGSYGCNLRCPFCQNDSISQVGEGDVPFEIMMPAELAQMAARLRDSHGNIGLAYTYNEPLVGWEFVRDCAREIHRLGMANVLVSNGCFTDDVISELALLIDAANIDLKGPSQDFYDSVCGDYDAVFSTIRTLHEAGCHVEVTTLVVPGMNDSVADMKAIATSIASISPFIPLHVTRFFPRFRLANANPTPVDTIYRLAYVARFSLYSVIVGNC